MRFTDKSSRQNAAEGDKDSDFSDWDEEIDNSEVERASDTEDTNKRCRLDGSDEEEAETGNDPPDVKYYADVENQVKVASESDRRLNPLLMIEAQVGQSGRDNNSFFGASGEEIFRKGKALRPRGRGKQPKRQLKTSDFIGERGETLKNPKKRLGGRTGRRRVSKNTLRLVGMAQQEYSDGNFVKALKICEQILRVNPRLSDPYHVMVLIFRAKGEKEKEFYSLQWACNLDVVISVDNLRRLAELGFELGRDEDLHEAVYGGDLSAETPGEKPKYSPSERATFLKAADAACMRLIRRQPLGSYSIPLGLKRGEILEHRREFRKAADLYRRILKKQRESDPSNIDLLIVHRLARCYSLFREISRLESVLEAHVECVLYPTLEQLPHINLAIEKSRAESAIKENAKRRKLEALRARKRELSKSFPSEQLSVSASLMEDAPKARPGVTPGADFSSQGSRVRRSTMEYREGRDNMMHTDDEGSSSEEESELHELEQWANNPEMAEEKAVLYLKEQLQAGMTILSMLVERSIEKGEYSRGYDFFKRFLEFRETGLCALPAKNQWHYWHQIKPLIPMDLHQMHVICCVNLKDFREARANMLSIQSHELKADEARRLYFHYKIADAWCKQEKYVEALNLLERLLALPGLRLALLIDSLSKAAFCCENIDIMQDPERAAQQAPGKAINFLSQLLSVANENIDDARFRCINLRDWKDSSVNRLDRMYRKHGRHEEADQLIVQNGFSAGYVARYGVHAHLSAFWQASNTSTGNSASSLEQAAGAPTVRQEIALVNPSSNTIPRTLLEATDSTKTVAKEAPFVLSSEFPLGMLKSAFSLNTVQASVLLDESLDEALECFHRLFLDKKWVELVLETRLCVAGLFREMPELFQKYERACLDAFASLETECCKPNFDERTVCFIECDQAMRFVQEICVALMNLKRVDIALLLLNSILPKRRNVFKDELYKSSTRVLYVVLCLEAGEVDSATRELFDVVKSVRDSVRDENRNEEWGDDIPFLWETLNCVLGTIKYTFQSSVDIRSIHRRLQKLINDLNEGVVNPGGKPLNFGMSMIVAHSFADSLNPVNALSAYFKARELSPGNALVALCLSTTYLKLYDSHLLEETARGDIVFKAFSHMQDYYEKRIEMAENDDKKLSQLTCEALFNCARMAHQIQAPFLFETLYRRCLSVPGATDSDKREAAYNLALYYDSIGNLELARDLRKTYLVI